MSDDPSSGDDLVVELLELAGLDSQYAGSLVANHRRRLVDRLLRVGKIDQETADYLLS